MEDALRAEKRLCARHLGLASLGPLLSFLPLILVFEESHLLGMWTMLALLICNSLCLFLGRLGLIISSLALGCMLYVLGLQTLNLSVLWVVLSLSLFISSYSWEELDLELQQGSKNAKMGLFPTKVHKVIGNSQGALCEKSGSTSATYKSLLKVSSHTLKIQNEKCALLQSKLSKIEKHFEDQNMQINGLIQEIQTLKARHHPAAGSKKSEALSKPKNMGFNQNAYEAKWKRALGVIADHESQEKRLLELISRLEKDLSRST